MSRSFTSTGKVDCGSVTLAQTLSMGAWARAPGGSNNEIVGVNTWAALYYSGGTTVTVEMRSGTWTWNAAAHGMTVANWNHILTTFDGASPATAPKLYCNGVDKGTPTTSAPSGTFSPTAAAYQLGNFNSGTAPFVGDIGYCTLNHVILTAGEVKTAYLQGYHPRGLVRFHPLWGDTTEPDLSGNKANGTVTNSAVDINPPVSPFLFVPATWSDADAIIVDNTTKPARAGMFSPQLLASEWFL